jgi:RNA-directed DNA polymerase
MLKALEEGVKGGKWHSLIDKVYSEKNLRAAFERVKRNKGSAGVDHVSVEAFDKRLDANIEALQRLLKDGTYRPQAVKRCWIPKPGSREKRPLGVPTVRDRVVQTALRNVLEPIFERDFAQHSYGFRPNRSCKDALRRVKEVLNAGYTHVVDADIKGYFDAICHKRLVALVRKKVADKRIRELVQCFLDQDVLDGLERWSPESGTPQGAVISPLLSNIYLDALDHCMVEHDVEMVRYADDLVLFCRDEASAGNALELLQDWMAQAALQLHPEKTHVVDYGAGGKFSFLGYEFRRGKHWVSKKSMKQIRAKIREKTRRTPGMSLKQIIGELNLILCGWFEYYQHSRPFVMSKVDGYTRMRLRSILRGFNKGRGIGQGLDHKRWPNAYFTANGLFCLEHARTQTPQSSRR